MPLFCSLRTAVHRLCTRACVSLVCSDNNVISLEVYLGTTKAFCVFVRPILEYASVIWNPHYMNQISKIEGVQRFFCKRLQGLWSHPYRSRLAQLGLDSLYCRRVKLTCLCYKILHNRVHLNCDNFFSRSCVGRTKV